MSTQPISTLERNVTIIAVVLGLILFALLGKTCIPKQSHEAHSIVVADTDTSTTHPDQSAKIKRLETELQSALDFGDVYQAELTDARAKRKAAEDALAALKKSIAAQKSSTAVPAAAVAAAAVATSKKVDIKPFQDEIASLKAQLAKLKADLEAKIAAKDSEIDLLKRAYDKLQATHKGCPVQITQLQNQIDALKKNGAASTAGTDKDFAKLKQEYALLQTSLNVIRKQGEKDRTELATLRPEVIALREALAKLRNKQIFAKSATDLAPAHSQLFSRLKALEGEDSDTLKKAYSAAEKELNSHAATRVYFGTGSVTVKASDVSNIEEIAKTANSGDSFLVVGYASKKGQSDLNRSLSSERATAVAKALLSKLGGKNHVQAVYLGETSRFGPTRKNQVVEIWKISK